MDDWIGNRNGRAVGGSAFPLVSQGGYEEHQHIDEGMSLRDWFAGQALTGLIGEGTLAEAQDRGADFAEFVAGASYRIANAMLAARNSKPEEAA